MWGIVAVVCIIMGGVYTGWMTPTESGAVGAFVDVHAWHWHDGMTKDSVPEPGLDGKSAKYGGDDHHHHLGHL